MKIFLWGWEGGVEQMDNLIETWGVVYKFLFLFHILINDSKYIKVTVSHIVILTLKIKQREIEGII